VTHSSSFCKSICLQLVIALVALLAVGPFLHAHLGVSTVQGLHVDGMSAVNTTHVTSGATSFSATQEHESAAVGVETAYARQISFDVQESPQVFVVCSVFVLAVFAVIVVPHFVRATLAHVSHLANLAEHPPLAHAPPAFRS
jgi:hypothetical protein